MSVDQEVSIAARKVLENHLWYLSHEAVGLALFSDELPAADEVKMVTRLTAELVKRRFEVMLQSLIRVHALVISRTSEHKHFCHA